MGVVAEIVITVSRAGYGPLVPHRAHQTESGFPLVVMWVIV